MPEEKDVSGRRNEFVDAAEKLFKENGIVETTINSIVKEVNVAKGLFYYYFNSKEDVIEAISSKYNEIFNEMMRFAMDQGEYIPKLHQFIENCVNSFRSLDDKLHGAQENIDLSILQKRSKDEAKSVAIDALTELFEEGVSRGELIMTHCRYYADILISGIMELIEERQATDEEIKEIIIDLIERAGKD
ncbi:MAG: TetR/AcrR family transcriptional regulator [Solobacterium sp.]|nr:TetR/AcrR family transcriptional regulator [Solobacterium sp.]